MFHRSEPDLSCRPKSRKHISSSSISDYDSGYDDLSVLSIPLVKTVIHRDAKGNCKSSTSTNWINIKNGGHTSPQGSKIHSATSSDKSSYSDSSPTSTLDSSPVNANRSIKNNRRNANKETNSKYFAAEGRPPRADEKEDKFSKKHKNELEQTIQFRGFTKHPVESSVLLPTNRDVSVSKIRDFSESTVRKVRRKPRSKSADGSRRGFSKGLFSPVYSKILSEEEMQRRREWAAIIRKDCIIEEEYYKVPYEECNREVILGRFSRSEPRLTHLRKSRKRVSFSKDTNQKDKDEYHNSKPNTSSGSSAVVFHNKGQNNNAKVMSDTSKSITDADPENGANLLSANNEPHQNLQTLIQLIKEIKGPEDSEASHVEEISKSANFKDGNKTALHTAQSPNISDIRQSSLQENVPIDARTNPSDSYPVAKMNTENTKNDNNNNMNPRKNEERSQLLPKSILSQSSKLQKKLSSDDCLSCQTAIKSKNPASIEAENRRYYKTRKNPLTEHPTNEKNENTKRLQHKKRLTKKEFNMSHPPMKLNKKAAPLIRNDDVDIFMRKNENFTDHHISLTTCVNSLDPSINVTRVKVPLLSIKDQWMWAKHFLPLTTTLDNQSKLPPILQSLRSKSYGPVASSSPEPDCNSNTERMRGYPQEKSVCIIEGISSPTPSCGSSSGSSTSGCFSASCSPTPPPPTTLRVFPLPTPL